MNRCALALQSCPQEVHGVYNRGAESPAKGADRCSGEVRGRGRGIGGGSLQVAGVAVHQALLEVFEGREVDGAVGEHAEEAHGKATVERADAGGAPHLEGGGGD